jgi:hypothetical protein
MPRYPREMAIWRANKNKEKRRQTRWNRREIFSQIKSRFRHLEIKPLTPNDEIKPEKYVRDDREIRWRVFPILLVRWCYRRSLPKTCWIISLLYRGSFALKIFGNAPTRQFAIESSIWYKVSSDYLGLFSLGANAQ